MKRSVILLGALILTGVSMELRSEQTAATARPGKRRNIQLPGRSGLPFSDGVLVGDTLYLAGRLGVDKDGRIPDDLEKEIRNLLDGMKSVLGEAAMTVDDLATVTVYCPDLTLYDKFNAVYRSYFSREFPARAFIGSGPLLRGAHFEIQAIAVKR
jgi:2-iminobutanoate/2-iminopropanoate deaminase